MNSPKTKRFLKFLALFVAVVALVGGAFFYYQQYMAPKVFLETLPFEEITTIDSTTYSGKLMGVEWIITTQSDRGLLSDSVVIEHIIAQEELAALDFQQIIKLFSNEIFNQAKIEWKASDSSNYNMIPNELSCIQSANNFVITYLLNHQGDIISANGEFIQTPAKSIPLMPIPESLANGAISGEVSYSNNILTGSGKVFSNQGMVKLDGISLQVQSGSMFEISNSELTIQATQPVTLKLNNQPTTASGETKIRIIDNEPTALFFPELTFIQDNVKIVLHKVTNNQNCLEAESAEWQLFDNSFTSGRVIIDDINNSPTANISDILQKNEISELKISSAKLDLATLTLFFATADLQQSNNSLKLSGTPEGSAQFKPKNITINNVDAKLVNDTIFKDMTLQITPNDTTANFKSMVDSNTATGSIHMQMSKDSKLAIQSPELKIANPHQQTTLTNFKGEYLLGKGTTTYQTGLNSNLVIAGQQALKLYNAEINEQFKGHTDIALLTPFNDSVVLKNLQLSKDNGKILAKNSMGTTVITIAEDTTSLDFKLSSKTSVDKTLNMGSISLSNGDWAIEAKVGKNYFFKLNADCSVNYRSIRFDHLKTACQLTLSEAGAKLEPEFKAVAKSAQFDAIKLADIEVNYTFAPQIFEANNKPDKIAEALHINSFTAQTLGGSLTMLKNGRFYAENLNLHSFCNEFLNLRGSQCSGEISGMVEMSSSSNNTLRFAPTTLATYPAETGNIKLKNLPLNNQDDIMTDLTSAALADFNYNYIRVDIMDRRVVFTAQGTPVKPLPFVINTANGEFQKTDNTDLFYMDEMLIELEFEL